MRKFRVLSVLLLVAVFIGTSYDIVVDMKQGFLLGLGISNYAESNNLIADTHVCLDVIPKDLSNINLNSVNEFTGDSVSVMPERISVTSFYQKNSEPDHSGTLLRVFTTISYIGIFVMFFLIAIYFVRIILAFSKNKIFDIRIQKWLRLIGICFIIMAIFQSSWQILRVQHVISTIELSEFDFLYDRCINWSNIAMGLIVLVMNEIVTIATTYKEDQDLTI